MDKITPISDVVWFQEGPGVRNTQYTTEGVKLLNVANLVDGEVDLSNTNRYISEEEAYGKYKHFLVDEGDLIIASSGIKVDYFDKKMGFIKKEHLPLCMNTSTIRFKTLNADVLDIRYFMYFLKSESFKQQLAVQITGSAQLNFGPSHLKKMSVKMVTMAQQKEIVHNLSEIDRLISYRQQQLIKLDELVKSRFIEMFGDPVNNSEGLPELTLPELGEFGRGISKHRPRNDPKLLGGKYPLIQTGEVANSNLYITEYESTYSELGFKQSKLWQKGTLCITIAANIAKTAILTFDACFPDSVVGFKANDKTNNIFIHYWFSFFQAILEAQAPESAQKNINLKTLSELKIIVPPIDLQNEFATFVEQTDKLKFEIKEAFEKLEIMKKALMQKYFG